MIHPISGSCQNQKAHGTVETHRLSASTDTNDEVKLDARSEDIGKKGHEQSDTDAQILLTALRNLIVPLIQSVVPNASAEFDGRPEEENLLIALQKYVASIIGGQVQADNRNEKKITRVINLKALNAPKAPEELNYDASHWIRTNLLERSEHHRWGEIIRLNAPGPGDPFAVGNLLDVLREHIFNVLPIHLLYFERLDNSDVLQISLLDRAGVYSRLAKKFTHTYTSTQVDDSTHLDQLIKLTHYAILSHTWLRSSPGELSYNAWNKGTFDLRHPGYKKLVQFCRASLVNHGISLGWMDTVCIDKSSSSELDESIRLMYKWYQNSSVCITYLSDTDTVSQLAEDTWFTRGWTLQELLAPEMIKFYKRTWRQLTAEPNDRYDEIIQKQITMATTITPQELIPNDIMGFHVPLSRKMQWAAQRQVTRAEDMAYSLMGIFNVSISVAYGEGADLAFSRLIKEIFSTRKHEILDIFNWGGEHMTEISSLLPSSPLAFLKRHEQLDISPILIEPLTLTHMGLRVPTLIVPIKVARSSATEKYTPKGDYYSSPASNLPEGVVLPFLHSGQGFYLSCNVLDLKVFYPRTRGNQRRHAFVVLNCTGDEYNINIPSLGFAVLIRYFTDDVALKPNKPIERVASVYPIIFPLLRKSATLEMLRTDYSMRRGELGHHGMQFLSMYI